MGIKKAQHGCISCMHSYFEVAKLYGATDEEIKEAQQQLENAQIENVQFENVQIEITSSEARPKNIGRRQLIKTAASASLATAAMAGWQWETISHTQAQAAEDAGHGMPMWWGTDSTSIANYGMPQNFYIGRMGYGGQPAGDSYFFNVNAARKAGYAHTFGYWGVVGPSIRPAGVSPYNWGKRQGACAWNAWHNGPHAAYHGGLTIFGDVEMGFGGWQPRNYGPNKAVLSGFLHELYTVTPPRSWPGLYTSPTFWDMAFGANYRPSTDFVLWLTGCQTCGNTICAPSAGCSTPVSARATMINAVSHTILGGRRTVLWQYWIGGCGCGDYNLMTQNALSLVPVNSARVYYPC